VPVSRYRAYIWSPTWRERTRRHLARHPWCVAHGYPGLAEVVHHSSYAGWRHLGVELPWEKVSLCHAAHRQVSRWHQGRWTSNMWIFLVTWAVVGWSRLRSERGRVRA
jgi:hypothetical protein